MDPAGHEKIWSESNMSEDFDMSSRLQMRGYTIRCARLQGIVKSRRVALVGGSPLAPVDSPGKIGLQ